jgi:hypothetical protein
VGAFAVAAQNPLPDGNRISPVKLLLAASTANAVLA